MRISRECVCVCVSVLSMEYAAALINYKAALRLILKDFKLYFKRKKWGVRTQHRTCYYFTSACMSGTETVCRRVHRNQYRFSGGESGSWWTEVGGDLFSLSSHMCLENFVSCVCITDTKMIFSIKFLSLSICALWGSRPCAPWWVK